jgi:hypothetical protein
MSKKTKLEIFEFVKYNALDDIIFEGFDTFDDNMGKLDYRRARAKEKEPFNQEAIVAHQDAQAAAINAEPIAQELSKYIQDVLPNIRTDMNRLSFDEVIARNGGDIRAIISPDNPNRPGALIRMLQGSVDAFMKRKIAEAQQKPELQAAIKAFEQKYGRRILDWITALAPKQA